MEYKVVDGVAIEFGVDPNFDNAYGDGYSVTLTKSELEYLLSKIVRGE